MARRAGCDGVASVGGGSSLDTAKLVAVLLSGEQPIADIYGVGKVKGGRMPLVLAPTTAGTGSEVTPIAIVTTGEAEKKGVVSPQLLPDWAILDAELTVGVPAHVTAATGIDAMVHAIEAFTSVHKKNPVSDCLAREALALLGANIRTACFDPENRQARGDMLLGSLLAGMAFANAPVMPSPIRSAAISMCPMACRTRSCCPMCWTSTCRRRAPITPRSDRSSFQSLPGAQRPRPPTASSKASASSAPNSA